MSKVELLMDEWTLDPRDVRPAPAVDVLALKIEAASAKASTGWERDFVASVNQQYARKGSLSPRQVEILDRIANPPARPQGVDISGVPSGHYAVEQRRYKVDNVTEGKWQGWVFVKDGSAYGAEERYGSQRPGQNYFGKRAEDVASIAADPLAAAQQYGRITGTCGCCGRALENPESVAFGIGPVCREKYFGGR